MTDPATDWKVDTRRFAEEVFVPVRDGWDVGRNLFRFFQLPLDEADDAVVAQAVKAVGSHLRRSSLAGVHTSVAHSLLPAFDDHATTMRETARRARHRTQVLAERAALVDQVRVELRDLPALRPEQVDELAARVRARFVRREVDEALAAAGIAVRSPVPLTVPPRHAGWADTRLRLRALGHAGLGPYLAAHRLTPRATDADIRRVRADLDRTRGAATLTAEEAVLGTVERLATAGTLSDALRRELLDELSEAAEQGAAALTAALAGRETAKRAAALGLPPRDDLAYALLCRARPVGSTDRGREDVEQAMVARELRTAFEILSARPNLPPDLADLRERVAADLARVDEGLAEAAALERDDPEAAAARYVAVLRLAREPEADAGLRRCRPPAPPAAVARVEGDRVAVTWEPAPVRAGDPRYRVVRRVDAGPHAGRTEIAQTADTSAADADTPAGTPAVYEVTTLRAGTTSAAPATTAPVVVLRSVTDLVAEARDGEVRLRWRLPDGAVAARVRRSDGAGRTEIAGGTATAHDTTVASGAHYTYTVEAAYDRDGTREFAPPATVDAHPQLPPSRVDDLRVVPDDSRDGDTAVAGWTPPAHGSVVLRVVHRPPPPAGTLLPVDAEVGEAVRMLGRDAAGVRIVLPSDGRRRWVVPLTVAGELAVVGHAVEHDRRLPPVVNLRAVRQGPQLRLSWEWPSRTGSARVLVREGGPVDGHADARATGVVISRAVFERTGCRVAARPGVEHWVAVGLHAHDDGQEILGPLVQVSVRPPPAARYTVLPAGRGRRTVVVVGDPPLPPVELRGRVSVPPLRRDEGDLLVTVRPADADAARMSAEFALTRGRPLHLRAFPADPTDDLELIPDDPEQLRVDRGRWW